MHICNSTRWGYCAMRRRMIVSKLYFFDDQGKSLDEIFATKGILEDIYHRLYTEMISEQAEVYLEDENLLQDMMIDLELDDTGEITKEQMVDYLDDFYSWGINFPAIFDQ